MSPTLHPLSSCRNSSPGLLWDLPSFEWHNFSCHLPQTLKLAHMSIPGDSLWDLSQCNWYKILGKEPLHLIQFLCFTSRNYQYILSLYFSTDNDKDVLQQSPLDTSYFFHSSLILYTSPGVDGLGCQEHRLKSQPCHHILFSSLGNGSGLPPVSPGTTWCFPALMLLRWNPGPTAAAFPVTCDLIRDTNSKALPLANRIEALGVGPARRFEFWFEELSKIVPEKMINIW